MNSALQTETAPVVFLATGMGTGLRYYFHSDIARYLLSAGTQVVGIVANPVEVRADFTKDLSGVALEHLNLVQPEPDVLLQKLFNHCTNYLRYNGANRTVNFPVARYHRRVAALKLKRGAKGLAFDVLDATTGLLQRSSVARGLLTGWLDRRPIPHLHTAVFEKYKPNLVVVTSPGWFPGDDQLIREARAHHVPSVALLMGWDHSSCKGLMAARPDRICVWSEIQKQEIVRGCDFDGDRIDVCGVAHFDHYQREHVGLSRDAYFERHCFDKTRRLITFVCSFVSHSSNVGMVRFLAESIAADKFSVPTQLLIRLHPTHLKKPELVLPEVREEVTVYEQLARDCQHVKIDYPLVNSQDVAMATFLADQVNLASLLRHTDVLVTPFSTMALEAAITDTPVICPAIDVKTDMQRERWLPITGALDWPTWDRIIKSGAAEVPRSLEGLLTAINRYLRNPELDQDARRRFAVSECTHLDGSSGERVGRYLHTLAARQLSYLRAAGG